jgi:hypothetical protein
MPDYDYDYDCFFVKKLDYDYDYSEKNGNRFGNRLPIEGDYTSLRAPTRLPLLTLFIWPFLCFSLKN